MPVYEHKATFDAPVDQLWAWYDSPGAFRRIMPEWEGIQPVEAGALVDDAKTRFRIRLGPLRPMWVARHHGVVSGEVFNDVMEKGPFGAWDHEHRFIGINDTSSQLDDTIQWRLPFHPLTFWTAPFTVNGRLKQMFAYRTLRVRNDLERINAFAHFHDRTFSSAAQPASSVCNSVLSSKPLGIASRVSFALQPCCRPMQKATQPWCGTTKQARLSAGV